jgi:hypothetical protein
MKRFDLIKAENTTKIGSNCDNFEPNILEDCIFYEDNIPVGFYIKKIPERMIKIADIANSEFRSKRVPKLISKRPKSTRYDEKQQKLIVEYFEQYSTILGSIPEKPQIRRNYKTISKVHNSKSSVIFIKAMLLLAKESEELIKEILPEQFEAQMKLFEKVPEEWRFGRLFTSSISNYNISAPFHRDSGNIKGAVNAIITKRMNATGGNLHIPDYNVTMDSANNSILVYPAWKNIHGVTPIHATKEGGYRNSLVFYPLKAFVSRE